MKADLYVEKKNGNGDEGEASEDREEDKKKGIYVTRWMPVREELQ